MTTRVAITLEDHQKDRLDALARAREVSPDVLAGEAVTAFLEDEAAFRAAVEEGLASDLTDFAEFAQRLRARMAAETIKSEA